MEIIREHEFEHAYKIMEEAFPASKRRPYQKMYDLFKKEAFRFFCIKEDQQVLGVIMCWECQSCVFVENFAVSKLARGKGIGSEILTKVKQYYNDAIIVLEVETPHDEMSERRIGFYNRNGFILNVYGYLQPKINETINEIPLLIMSYPKRLTKQQYDIMKTEIFHDVYEVEN